jgi:peptidoglycan/xylan/chitin deacetylase (PgdA/CDA1 family)
MVAPLLARGRQFSLQNHGARHMPAVLGAVRPYGLAVAGTLAAVEREVADGAAAITAAGAPQPGWYRGATALYSPPAMATIEAMGFRVAGFSLNADEGASLPAGSAASRIAAARPGDIIIAHVNHPERPSGAGVVTGVETLLAKGFGFVGLDARPVTALDCRRIAA